MDQPGKVVNSARRQLNRENEYFPVPSRVSLASSSPYSDWIWCLLTGFLPISAAESIHLYRHTPSAQSRVYPVTQLRTDGAHCR